MNFNELYKKIADLDKPVQECGEMPTPGMSSPSSEPKPSMSINVNAQGLDNIGELMKLMAKLNPDTAPAVDKLLPSLSNPNMKPPMPGMDGDKPALPMPVDMDGEEDGEEDHDDDEGVVGGGLGGVAGGMAGSALGTAVGGPIGGAIGNVVGTGAGAALGSKIGDKMSGDEEQEEESADGGFGSASTSPDVSQKDISASVPSGDDMHKVKKGYARSQPGDNPRAVEESDLSTKIKNDLFAQYESFKHR